jgi:hypothetical protein
VSARSRAARSVGAPCVGSTISTASSSSGRKRVLGRDEVRRLLAACLPRYRPLIATALYTGMRISELLGLVWDDFDPRRGVIHVRAQLSRAHRGVPAHRVPPKTPHRSATSPSFRNSLSCSPSIAAPPSAAAGGDWVFAEAGAARRSGTVTPSGERWVRRPGSPASRPASGRRYASTTSATPSPAT